MSDLEQENYFPDLVAYANNSISTVNSAVIAAGMRDGKVPLAEIVLNIDKILKRKPPEFLQGKFSK